MLILVLSYKISIVMRNILIPTDFSKNAHEALFYAIKLFKNEPCTFHILHTFEVNTPIFTSRLNTVKGKLLYNEKLTAAQNQINEILVSLSIISEGSVHSFETLIFSKPLIETIHKTIQHKKIDLVVMGTKGASGLKEKLFGSNTVKMLKSIQNTPLLIVPLAIDKFTLDRIAFATDFKNGYTKRSLATLKEFCELHDGEVETIHVDNLEPYTTTERNNIQVLEKGLQNTEYNVSFISKTKSTEKHILEYIDEVEDFDLLAMIKYQHDDFYNWMNEPVINKLGYHTKIPFLVIPE